MIQKLNWENRIPVNVLSNNAVRYGIYDSEGNLLRYEYIKKEDEAVTTGTVMNKIQGDKIDDNTDELIGERSRVDRYNIPTISEIDSEIQTTDIVPKSWISIGALNTYYRNDDDTIRLYPSSTYSSSYSADLACDGDISTEWRSDDNNINEYLKLYFATPLKITKMKIHITANADYLTSWSIQGSNDDENWTDLYTSSTKTTELTEITLSNNNYYNYYRIYMTKSSGNRVISVYEWQVSEWIGRVNLLTLNNNIDSYFNNQIVLIDMNDNAIDFDKTFYININNIGNKEIEGIDKIGKYTLVYNGTKFIAKEDDTIINNISIKTGTISNGATIPQTSGYSYYMYFVSMNNAIASKYQTINTTIQYRKIGIECSVNQSTRVVTARLGIDIGTSESGDVTWTNGTANYMEIAWN